MENHMKFVPVILTSLIIFLSGCATAIVAPPAVAEQKEEAAPIIVDFGEIWTGAIRFETEKNTNLSDGTTQATFDSEWTKGENAGNVFPKQFISVETGSPVDMNFLWDNGGEIPAGTYDVQVDIDGNPEGGWIRNLKLSEKTNYTVIIHLNAAKLNIELEGDGDEIYTYPAGTHDKYDGLGRLDDIPDDLVVTMNSSYTERNQIYWMVPSVPLDVEFRHADGSVDWFINYSSVPESAINQLP